MAIIQGNAKQGSTRGFYPKTLAGSLRFNDGDQSVLTWTPDAAGTEETWTFSCWVKKCENGSWQGLLAVGTADGSEDVIAFDTTDRLTFRHTTGSDVKTSAKFRDPSAWYHIMVVADSTQSQTSSTASDSRIRFYLNGSQVVDFDEATMPSQNHTFRINTAAQHYLGEFPRINDHLEGYLANVHFIDGQALTASDFGSFKNGVWVAEDYAGTFGPNGFHLTFEDDTEVEAFNTVLYRGNGATSTSTQSITGVGFSPDFVWIKNRDNTTSNSLYDTVRGADVTLRSNTTDTDFDYGNTLLSFDSDGFTVGDYSHVNGNGLSHVAWCWKAGGAPTVDNSAGAGNVPTAGSVKIDGVNSTSALAGSTPATRLSASNTYGFSIVTWDAPASGATTVTHGLTSAPDFVICKIRNVSTNWQTWHTGLSGGTYTLFLNGPGKEQVQADAFGAVPTSSVLNIGSDFSGSGRQNIAYCWAEKPNYSKFGSFTGEGANNATISKRIYTTNDGTSSGTGGFRPSMIIFKRTDSASVNGWYLFDSTRDTDAVVGYPLYPDQNYAEGGTDDVIQFNDDGFTIVRAYQDYCGAGGTYIYAAFADTREAAFWLDQSGNDNDWQPVNLDHNDTVSDSPTDNFCTWNPLAKLGSVALPTFSDGNLTLTTNASVDTMAVATMGITSGTFYYEATLRSANTYHQFGVASKTDSITTSTDRVTYFGFNGYIYNNATSTSGYGTNSAGDVLGVACDADAGTVKFYLNNTLLSTESWTSNTGLYIPFMAGSNGTYTADVNFGQQPFKYDPPA